jgi:hypothetical protein
MTYIAGGARSPARAASRRMTLWAHAPLAVALALRLASAPTADLSYAVIAAYAFLGRPHAIRALAMSWLFGILSPGIAPEAAGAALGRYAVLFAAAASVFAHSAVQSPSLRLRGFTLATLLLGLFLVVHSLLLSPIADVSLLKSVSWTLAMVTIVSAWSGLSPGSRRRLEGQLFGGIVLVLLVSLPLVALPVGYLTNGTGFQGILNHPQAFGPTMALLGAWAAARMFGEEKPGWLLVGLAGTCLAMVLLSEARTAGLALVGGVALAIIVAPAVAGRSVADMLPGLRSARVWTVLGAVLLGGLVLAPQIAGMVGHYMTKSGRAGGSGFAELYDGSRGRIIAAMRDNIAEHPLAGIGFGIASEPETMEVSRDPVFGLPIGASIEKGVVPLMVVEEVGIVGAALVAFWLMWLLRSAARGGVAAFAVCLTALLTNMGEATLFSPGGLGLLLLLLLGWAGAGGPTKRGRHG